MNRAAAFAPTANAIFDDDLHPTCAMRAAFPDGGFRMLGPAASVEHALDVIAEERPSGAVLYFNLGGERVTQVALQLKALGW